MLAGMATAAPAETARLLLAAGAILFAAYWQIVPTAPKSSRVIVLDCEMPFTV
jgi:hypothetical protein